MKECIETCALIMNAICCEDCPVKDCKNRCDPGWSTCVCRRRLLPRPSPDIRSIAVDFDGCLVTDAWPAIGEPNGPLIDELTEYAAGGCKIILWTCRHDERLAEAVKAAESFGIVFDAVNENPFSGYEDLGDTRKIYADLYVDDRALKVVAK